ncbi:hypothetical protein CGLO_17987 [Colletotrichum gloeosporioides Cg-14]|nr:hypothetical protein CGLO_17987 [Colletotrichum gloeosporioides Cg-14]
MVTEPDE